MVRRDVPLFCFPEGTLPGDDREDHPGNLFMDADNIPIISHDEDDALLRDAHKDFTPICLAARCLLVEEMRRP